MSDENNLKTELDERSKKRNIEIELIKRDIFDVIKVYNKMDGTLDRIQQISSDLSKIISEHEYRIQSHTKDITDTGLKNEKIYEKIEKSDEKMEQILSTLDKKILQIESNILSEVASVKSDIIYLKNIGTNEHLISRESLKELKEDLEKNYISNERFQPIQKIVYGVASVIFTLIVGIIINQLFKLK